MIAAALRAEADEYVAQLAEEVDEHGRRLVVRKRPSAAAAGDRRLGHGGDPGAAGQ